MIYACVVPRPARRSAGPARPFDYAAKTWAKPRRVVARLEATARSLDARYIVTTLMGSAERLYETDYCARSQAENFIKLHRSATDLTCSARRCS